MRKRKRTRKGVAKPGLSPGTAVYVGEPRGEAVAVTLFQYDAEGFHERAVTRIEDLPRIPRDSGVAWINVDGVHDLAAIEAIGHRYGLHPLIVEDVVNTAHRPKLEDYESYLFLIVKMVHTPTENSFTTEQVSLVLGPGFVLSFQERKGDVFDPVRQRIRNGKGRIRKSGADYLAYALIDAVVDHYFVMLEKLEEQIEGLGDRVLSAPEPNVVGELHHLKRELVDLRRSIWPLREVVAGLQRSDPPLVRDETRLFLQDLYDHTIQVLEVLDAFREETAGLRDAYMTNVSNRMNEIMKVLTLIATLFIPLTFLVGVYGMNFKAMPELGWPWAYPALWGVMIAVSVLLLVFFKRKKWL